MSEPHASGTPIDARLDLGRVLPLISRHLPDCRDRLELLGGELLSIQFKPEIECLGHYRLRFRRRGGSHEVSQDTLLYLTDVAPRPVTDAAAMAAYRELRLPIRSIETEIPELSAVLIPSELDPGLPHLAETLNDQVMRQHLKPLIRTEGHPLLGVRARLISHTPRARATIRYHLWMASSPGSPPQKRGIVGKLNAHRDLAPVMADYYALWRCTADQFQQARPLGMLQNLGISLQTLIEGERLNTCIGSGDFPSMLSSVAKALAAFHRAPLPLQQVRDPMREIRSVSFRSRVLRAVVRDSVRVDRLFDRLTEAMMAHCETVAPVHADFHHANVMANNAGIALIDFDEMGFGDPALDVGRFTISLSIPSLRSYGDLRLVDLARDYFLRTYLAENDVASSRLRLFEAASFLVSAVTLWRFSRAGWENRIPEMIGLAESALDDALRRPPPRRPDADPPAPSAADRLRWSEDAGYLAQLMRPAVHCLHGAEIHRTQATVQQNNDGALSIACAIFGATPVRSWRGNAGGICRAGLAPRASEELIKRLRETLCDDPDAFLIPPVLGMNERLGLLLWEKQKSRTFHVSRSRDGKERLAHLARALAQLHRAGEALVGEQSVADCRAHDDACASGDVFGTRVVPSIASPDLSDFGIAHDRIIIRRPDKLCLAPGVFAAAEIERKIAARAGLRASDLFREEYLARSGSRVDDAAAVPAVAASPRRSLLGLP